MVLKIEGRWYGLSFDSVQNIINLERKGHSVEGSMICLTGLDKGEEYIIKGTFKNLVLSLLYETKDSIKTDRGSLTLMAKNNGCRLKGQIACYDNAGDIINVGDVIWYRTEIDLMNRLKASEFLKDKLDSLRTERLKLRIQKTEIESDIENLIMNGTLQNIKAEGENYSEASEGDNH